MNEQHANTKSASPVGEGERIACHAVAKRRREVRGKSFLLLKLFERHA
jgi:hypothetical protein